MRGEPFGPLVKFEYISNRKHFFEVGPFYNAGHLDCFFEIVIAKPFSNVTGSGVGLPIVLLQVEPA